MGRGIQSKNVMGVDPGHPLDLFMEVDMQSVISIESKL